jgi:hypothetical protein
MTESGHAASFGIVLIIKASAAAVERHDGVCAEAGAIPQQLNCVFFGRADRI